MSNICNFSLFSNQSNNLIFVKLQALTKFANVSITVLLVCSGKVLRTGDWVGLFDTKCHHYFNITIIILT